MLQRVIAVLMMLAAVGLGWLALAAASQPAIDADDAAYLTRITLLIGMFAVALGVGGLIVLGRQRRN